MGSILSKIEDDFDELKMTLDGKINAALAQNNFQEAEFLKNKLQQVNPRYLKTGQRLNNSRNRLII